MAREFVYDPGIDEPICMIDITAGGTVYYYHLDGLGSVAALSNNNGGILEQYEYDVFGDVTILSPSGESRATSDVGNAYMFTGRRLDNETGLYYYRARYYNAENGRFLQTDPVGYAAGLNLYTYCNNNAVIYKDPAGVRVLRNSYLVAPP